MRTEPGWRSAGPGEWAGIDASDASGPPAPRTALRILDGRPVHAQAHLQRLRAGCAALDSAPTWLDAAFEAAHREQPDGILRIQVHPTSECLLYRWEEWGPPPSPYRLIPGPHPLGDTRGHPLASHKGLMGRWHAAALAEAKAAGASDRLCLWPDGSVAETAIAAVALVEPGFLRLPPLEGRVASLAERLDLPAWAEARGLGVEWRPFHLSDIEGRSLLCFNAARGLWHAEVLLPPP